MPQRGSPISRSTEVMVTVHEMEWPRLTGAVRAERGFISREKRKSATHRFWHILKTVATICGTDAGECTP